MAQFSLVCMTPPTLLAVPNVSEGRDERIIASLAAAFAGEEGPDESSQEGRPTPPTSPRRARLLDVHADRDHHRAVFTLAGEPGSLADAVLAGARVAVQRIDVMARSEGGRDEVGQHPHVGALDVVPIVYLDAACRGAACAEALVVADRIGAELDVPVFLYGELSGTGPDSERTRAELRRGGLRGLAQRMVWDASGAPASAGTAGTAGISLEGRALPDFGPSRLHPSAGATLLAARPPLVAFNLQLAEPAGVAEARRVAALIREGGAEGLPGVRAIGVTLDGQVAQVSMNLEQPLEVPMARVIEAVRRQAEVASAELVGLAPRAALEGFPPDVPMPGFDPGRHVIENALG